MLTDGPDLDTNAAQLAIESAESGDFSRLKEFLDSREVSKDEVISCIRRLIEQDRIDFALEVLADNLDPNEPDAAYLARAARSRADQTSRLREAVSSGSAEFARIGRARGGLPQLRLPRSYVVSRTGIAAGKSSEVSWESITHGSANFRSKKWVGANDVEFTFTERVLHLRHSGGTITIDVTRVFPFYESVELLELAIREHVEIADSPVEPMDERKYWLGTLLKTEAALATTFVAALILYFTVGDGWNLGALIGFWCFLAIAAAAYPWFRMRGSTD